jgi:hypothetical protein
MPVSTKPPLYQVVVISATATESPAMDTVGWGGVETKAEKSLLKPEDWCRDGDGVRTIDGVALMSDWK